MEHRIGCGRRYPSAFESAHHDVHPPVDDAEQKGVSNRERKLMAHGGRALGVAMEQEIGHERVRLTEPQGRRSGGTAVGWTRGGSADTVSAQRGSRGVKEDNAVIGDG